MKYRRRLAGAGLTGGLVMVLLSAVIACTQVVGPTADDPGATGTQDADGPDSDVPVDVQRLFIDFQNEAPGFAGAAFAGLGAMREPEAGYLDADAWEVIGFSDGDRLFGEESTVGDHARGQSSGGVSTGGLYAFTVADGDVALGVQPTTTDFAPGSIAMRVPLQLSRARRVDLSYVLHVWNDQDRSSEWSLSISTDGTNWIPVEALIFTTAEIADPEPEWTRHEFSMEIDVEMSTDSGHDAFFVRWSSGDHSGSGGRDEVAIGEIGLTLRGIE